MASSIKDPILVSIIGGSGYTGAELMRLISKHPHFELNQVVANRNSGKKIEDIFPHLRHLALPDFINFRFFMLPNTSLLSLGKKSRSHMPCFFSFSISPLIDRG